MKEVHAEEELSARPWDQPLDRKSRGCQSLWCDKKLDTSSIVPFLPLGELSAHDAYAPPPQTWQGAEKLTKRILPWSAPRKAFVPYIADCTLNESFSVRKRISPCRFWSVLSRTPLYETAGFV
jgi:hypothetical protein